MSPAAIETAMFLRKPAWHKLGKVWQRDITFEEARESSGLTWRVDMKALFTKTRHSSGALELNETPYFSITRDSDNKSLGVATDKYKPFQNFEAFEWTRPFIDSGFWKYEAAGALLGGKRCWVLLKQGEREVTAGDKLKCYLLLTWEHTGKGSIKVANVSIRVVCDNTLRMALREGGKDIDKVRHDGSMKKNMEQVRNIYLQTEKDFDDQKEWFQKLLERPVTDREEEEFVSMLVPIDYTEESTLTVRQVDARERDREFLLSMARGKASGSEIPGVRGSAYGLYMATSEANEHYMGGGRVKDRGTYVLEGVGAQRDTQATELMNELLAKPVGEFRGISLS